MNVLRFRSNLDVQKSSIWTFDPKILQEVSELSAVSCCIPILRNARSKAGFLVAACEKARSIPVSRARGRAAETHDRWD